MREGIIYNSAPQEEALERRLYNKIQNSDIPQNIKDGLTKSAIVITHPVNNKVFLEIQRNGYYWEYIAAELTQAEANSIEPLTDDWTPESILI